MDDGQVMIPLISRKSGPGAASASVRMEGAHAQARQRAGQPRFAIFGRLEYWLGIGTTSDQFKRTFNLPAVFWAASWLATYASPPGLLRNGSICGGRFAADIARRCRNWMQVFKNRANRAGGYRAREVPPLIRLRRDQRRRVRLTVRAVNLFLDLTLSRLRMAAMQAHLPNTRVAQKYKSFEVSRHEVAVPLPSRR